MCDVCVCVRACVWSVKYYHMGDARCPLHIVDSTVTVVAFTGHHWVWSCIKVGRWRRERDREARPIEVIIEVLAYTMRRRCDELSYFVFDPRTHHIGSCKHAEPIGASFDTASAILGCAKLWITMQITRSNFDDMSSGMFKITK